MKTYISITSIFCRQAPLAASLNSILSQTGNIDKIYLNLSEEPYLLDDGFKNRNITDRSLKETLKNDLIEVCWVKNTGPHRKLLPTLQKHFDDDCVIITLDDDFVFNPKLIESLVNTYKETPEHVITARKWHLDISKGWSNLSYYNRLTPKLGAKLEYFHTGGAGTLYSPSHFAKVKDKMFDESVYMNICKYADDVWFNMCRIKSQTKCRWIKIDYRTSPMRKDKKCLNTINNNNADRLNDVQIKDCIKYFEIV